MKLKLLFLGFFCFFITTSRAQEINVFSNKEAQYRIDSLTYELETKNLSYVVKIKSLHELAELYDNVGKAKKASCVYEMAAQLAASKEDEFQLALTQYLMGTHYMAMTSFTEAKNLFNKVISSIEKHKGLDKNNLLVCTYLELNSIHIVQGNMESARKTVIRIFELLPPITTTVHEKELKVIALSQMGIIHLDLYNIPQAAEGLLEAKLIINKEPLINANVKARVYALLSEVFLDKESNEESRLFFNKAVALLEKEQNYFDLSNCYGQRAASEYFLGNFDTALRLLDKSQHLAESYKYKDLLAYNHILYGNLYLCMGKYELATFHNAKGLKLTRELGLKIYHCRGLITHALLADHRENLQLAIVSLDSALSVEKTLDNLKLQKDIYGTYMVLYDGKDMHKSLDYSKKYITVIDSLDTLKEEHQLGLIKQQLALGKLVNEYREQQHEILLNAEKSRGFKYVSIFTIVLVVLIIVFSVIIYKKQRRLLYTKKRLYEAEKRDTANELAYKNNQITDLAVHLTEKNTLLLKIKSQLKEVDPLDKGIVNYTINEIVGVINEDVKQNNEKVQMYANVHRVKDSFEMRLVNSYPDLKPHEIKIATLLRVGQSSKQIAYQLNISPASVNNYRLNLRKKMNLEKDVKLVGFIKSI